MTAVIVAAAAVGMFACLCGAMSRGRRDRAYPVRPVPPRPCPVGSPVWVDPGPVDPDAPWRDPLAGAWLAEMRGR